jgi:lysophospholipid acyltransferase (LPLAT)-like uncharacterized protein
MTDRKARNSWFKRWRKRLAYGVVPLLSALGLILIRCFSATMRVRLQGEEPLIAMREAGRPFLLAFFHGRQFLLVSKLSGWPAVIPASISYMGEIQSGILEGFGYKVVRGSSSRGGARVLGEMMRHVRRGRVGAFAVDGPRGPGKVVKPGIIFAARKMGIPVVPVATSARPSRVFVSAWDRYMLPMPFCRGLILFGSPWVPPGGSGDARIREACATLARMLDELETRADALIGKKED